MGILADFSHFVAILALVSLAWVAVMIHKIVKRMDEIEEDYKRLTEMLKSLDEKLINFDLDAHISEKLTDDESGELDELDTEDLTNYLKKILNKHDLDKD